MTAAKAIAEVKKCAGTQFDPVVVKAFLKIPLINSLKI
jgi:HD-GYP domain-containing protein (c-di-GMP phosphodiesterase class II)